MFVRKLQGAAILGAVLSVLAIIGTLSEGKGIGEAIGMIPGVMFLSVVAVFWFTRNMDGEGNDVQPSADQQIAKLQNKLRSTLQTAVSYEEQGNFSAAGQMRSYAAGIESELRSLGA